ncbi:CvpA family protein [Erythrobacter tepidarius]|uniref:CvpA family protein n=1 Tax=Erythrobacter tepidarius TaxID=60454 RepID=UPI000A3C4C35|nr:CvpA family protein [Erythrobacter tepidarius]
MAGLDIIILIIVAVAAIGGFMRGLVQEVLSLASWVFAALAVHFLHPVLAPALSDFFHSSRLTPVFAFVLLLLIPYAAMKLIAANISGASDGAILGPVDRVLGFGFGAVKGALIAGFAFSLLALGFDERWGYKGRPNWITEARTYSAADAFSRELVPMIAIRRDQLRRESEAQEAAAARAAK